MNNKKIAALLLTLASTASHAGTMSPAILSERLLLIESGVLYSHTFYSGTAFNPNDFFGGYIGASLYVPSNWLMNARYDIYGKKTNFNNAAQTTVSMTPTKLSLTIDRVFANINEMSYGVGAGAVIEFLNNSYIQAPVTSSTSLQSRTTVYPLVEAFAMYRVTDSFGMKINTAYQIPVQNKGSNGDLNLSLGFNYAFSM